MKSWYSGLIFFLYEFIPVDVDVFCTLHFGDLWPPPAVSNQLVRK